MGTVAPLVALPGTSVAAPLLEAPVLPTPPGVEPTPAVSTLFARSPSPESATFGPAVAAVPIHGPAVAAKASILAGPADSFPCGTTGFPSAAPAVVVTAAGRLPVAASVPVRPRCAVVTPAVPAIVTPTEPGGFAACAGLVTAHIATVTAAGPAVVGLSAVTVPTAPAAVTVVTGGTTPAFADQRLPAVGTEPLRAALTTAPPGVVAVPARGPVATFVSGRGAVATVSSAAAVAAAEAAGTTGSFVGAARSVAILPSWVHDYILPDAAQPKYGGQTQLRAAPRRERPSTVKMSGGDLLSHTLTSAVPSA
ncbi:hypothetical protein ACFHWT_14070, partial [Micromonospora sp. LOL_021]